ncbi:MAG: universal stress protein [Bacteroidetes bacterium]|nr:universal stress protein [Bacteroidota bacterium]
MNTIYLLTNFSEAAEKAILNFMKIYGRRMKDDYRFLLINAWKQPRTGHFQMINLDEYLLENSMIDLKKQAGILAELLHLKDSDIELISRKGDIVDVVNNLTESDDPELIVMGTKGSNLLRELLIGSTAGRILRQIKLPTLIIPEKSELIHPDRIVFATDLNECSNEDDFEKLTNLARRFMAEFLILHIYKVEKPDVSKYEECMEQYLNGINYSFHYQQHVDIESGIIEFVSLMKAGLLAMIGRKDDLLLSLFKHSVTQGITQQAEVPMLIIHD